MQENNQIPSEEKLQQSAPVREPLAAEADALQRPTPKTESRVSTKTRILAVVALVVVVAGLLLGFPLFQPSSPLSRNETVLTVEGFEVSSEEYRQYLGGLVANYVRYAGPEFLEDEAEFLSIKQNAESYFIEYYALLAWANEQGYTKTEEDEAYIQEMMDAMVEGFGSEEALQEALAGSLLTEELYRRLLLQDSIRMRFVNDMYDTEKSPYMLEGEAFDAYCEQIGVLGAKHIFFFAGETEEEDAAVLERAEQVLARLEAGEDFDALMQEFSEDPGLAQYPDGYTFVPGEMVAEFTAATEALQIGQHSGIVPSSSGGYHIILRIQPNHDEAVMYVLDNQLYNDFEARIEAAEVSYGRGYDNISYADFTDVVLAATAEMEQQSGADSSTEGGSADGGAADSNTETNQNSSGADEEPKG